MAETGVHIESEADKLKYLEFVQAAAFNALVCFSNLYSFAKENSGSLKQSVVTVEERVKTIVGPVVIKYQTLPNVLLKFLDNKVDESVIVLDSKVPPTLKTVATQAVSVLQKTPGVARSVVSGVQQSGVLDTASGVAKTVYGKCEPKAKDLYSKYAGQLVIVAWYSLHQLPFFPQMGKAAVFCSDKYNQTVHYTTEKGYKVSCYLPLLPTEKITKAFTSTSPVSEKSPSTGDEAATVESSD